MSKIEVINLTKMYSDVCALDNVSLTFENDKIYGLLGRNGAGKSTMLNIITNSIFPTSGEVLVDGEPVNNNDTALSKMYLMREGKFYPNKLRISDVFKWTNQFYIGFNHDYALELADLFELNIRKKVGSLSTGYMSIFKLIIALSVNTPFVFFDEPVLGLDANHRDLFYSTLIKKYSESPSTIIISTHLIEEISNIVEDIVIINKGNIMVNESCQELLSKGYTAAGIADSIDNFIKGKDVIGTDSLGGLKTAYLLGTPDNVPSGIEISKMDLQKLFIKLTNDKGGDNI